MTADIDDMGDLQLLGRLASGVAHDFANVLTSVIGASDAALARPLLDDAVAAELRRIRADAERGTALVRQILQVGRPQSLAEETLLLGPAIDDAAEWLGRLLPPTAKLVVSIGVPAALRLGRSEFGRVIANLVLNARDAIGDDPGRITLRGSRVVFGAPLMRGGGCHRAGAYARISVTDTGAGIAPDVLPRIFEPFFTTRLGRGGSGIGLATVRDIVRRAGGWIDVDSVESVGTCFTVFLPAEMEDEATGTSQHRTVLFVDDEPTLLLVARQRFAALGWTVMLAHDAAVAIELAADCPPDLLITDVALPDASGTSLLASIRACQPELPAIVTSGEPAWAVRCARHANVTFLPKPYTFDQLVRLAHRASIQACS